MHLGKNEVEKAIESALEARKAWSKLSFQHKEFNIALPWRDRLQHVYRTKIKQLYCLHLAYSPLVFFSIEVINAVSRIEYVYRRIRSVINTKN